VVLFVGKPAGAIADALPFAKLADDATAWVRPDESLDGNGSFATLAMQTTGVPPVTPDAFDPAALGEKPPAPKPLKTLLVTGDSLSTPLDTSLARDLTPSGVKVLREPHLGSGISKSFLVDWGQLSSDQVRKDKPDAVVVFIGANEGYPLPGPGGEDLACCGPQWAAAFANRVRQMMNTYRQGGAARVYWLTVPTPRDPDRQRVEKAVNAAIEVAAQPWASQVRVVDTVPVFTPGEKYRDAMDVDGSEKIVRESDGIHLNDTGSAVAAEVVLDRVDDDFTF